METSMYRTQLEEEKARLEGELATVGRPNPSNPNDWEAETKNPMDEETSDPNDQASQLDQYQENASILTDLENRYNEVKAALARLDAGTYGSCEVCSAPIEAERLTADPAARTCIAHR